MVARKILECWIGWLLIDILATWIYAGKDLHLTAALYAGLAALAVKGWYDWRQTLPARTTAG